MSREVDIDWWSLRLFWLLMLGVLLANLLQTVHFRPPHSAAQKYSYLGVTSAVADDSPASLDVEDSPDVLLPAGEEARFSGSLELPIRYFSGRHPSRAAGVSFAHLIRPPPSQHFS